MDDGLDGDQWYVILNIADFLQEDNSNVELTESGNSNVLQLLVVVVVNRIRKVIRIYTFI